MRKVRLQAVVSTQVANRLKEEADKRGSSVSAVLGLAAEAFLAPKKAPPIPQRYATEREVLELKEKLNRLLQATPSLALEESQPTTHRVNSGIYSRTGNTRTG
jgi:hypothetical protein